MQNISGMITIVFVRHPFEIIYAVVLSVTIFVVNY